MSLVTTEDTRARILVATVAQIEDGGEAAVRLRDIAASVGISEPSLYHYFRSRESLIVAAHAKRFRDNLAVTLTPFVDALSGCTSREQFLASFVDLYRRSFPPERVPVRSTRTEIIGASFHRPELRETVATEMEAAFAPAIDLLREAQAKGWLRSDLSIEAFVYWNMANITGLIYPELRSDPTILPDFRDLIIEALVLVIGGQPPARE